jgi:hypothetical protein
MEQEEQKRGAIRPAVFWLILPEVTAIRIRLSHASTMVSFGKL